MPVATSVKTLKKLHKPLKTLEILRKFMKEPRQTVPFSRSFGLVLSVKRYRFNRFEYSFIFKRFNGGVQICHCLYRVSQTVHTVDDHTV